MGDWWNRATVAVQGANFSLYGETVTLHRAGESDVQLVGIPRVLGEMVDEETNVPIKVDGLELDVRKGDLPGEETLPSDEWTVRGVRYHAGAPLDDGEAIVRFPLYRFRSR